LTVLAHQGGWDEILMVAGPIVVITGLLLLVRKRIGDLPPPDRTVEGSSVDAPDVGTQ
jgi:hypothetical protein